MKDEETSLQKPSINSLCAKGFKEKQVPPSSLLLFSIKKS